MAGQGSRFQKNGVMIPKPIIEFNNKPFFVMSLESFGPIQNLNSLFNKIYFIVLHEHVESFKLDQIILNYVPSAEIKILPKVLNGPIKSVESIIDSISQKDIPVLINDCDHYFTVNNLELKLKNYLSNDYYSGVLTFNSAENRYSYVKKQNDIIIDVAEKKVISKDAICGLYAFKSTNALQDLIQQVLAKPSQNSEYFVSDLIRQSVLQKHKTFSIACDRHESFGTPEELNELLEKRISIGY